MRHESIELSGSKILIVDDTPANIALLTKLLEPEDFAVSFATNGEQAIKLPHLIYRP